MKAISLHSVIPVRAKASETAEMTTQMLFAETCEVLSRRANWTKIRIDMDGQEGWVDTKMLSPLTDEEYQSLNNPSGKATSSAEGTTSSAATSIIKMPMAYAVSANNGQTLPLTAGTRLPNYTNGQFSLLGVAFRIDPSMVAATPLTLTQENLLATVRFFLNIPYLWGGKNAMGLDCSGFTQTIMSIFGRTLLRNASEQATQGKPIRSLREAQPGDLVFFDHADIEPERTHISHVGILIDSERVIHCSGRVKVEKIDNRGIYSAEYGRYTHHLNSIRRI